MSKKDPVVEEEVKYPTTKLMTTLIKGEAGKIVDKTTMSNTMMKATFRYANRFVEEMADKIKRSETKIDIKMNKTGKLYLNL